MCCFRDKSFSRQPRHNYGLGSEGSRPPIKGKAMTAVTPIRAGQQSGRAENIPGRTRDLTPNQAGAPSGLRAVDDLSEVRAVTRGTVQAAMEVLAGIRLIHQLARRLDPRCMSALQHRACLIRREVARTNNPALARLHRNSVVRSVRVCEVAEGI